MRQREALRDRHVVIVRERVPIPGASNDRRAQRTREQLSWALIDLIREKDYEAISVRDIAGRAQVGRSTFYAYFRDKDDMFVQHSLAFNRAFGERLSWDTVTASWRFPVRGLFEHVRDFRFLYDALAKSRRLDRMLKMGQNALAALIGTGFAHLHICIIHLRRRPAS
jgi:AcrR family transcriptional regulator